jgi:hypothetical protein
MRGRMTGIYPNVSTSPKYTPLKVPRPIDHTMLIVGLGVFLLTAGLAFLI